VRGAGPPLLVLLAASACGVHNRPQLRWIGQLTPTADAAHCPSSRGVLLLREGKVSFAPDEGTWVLEGTAGPGTLQATRTRFTPDHKTYETKLDAHWTESAVQGTYTTPLCSYRVDLSRS
jgi:hypothetical protein